MSSSKKDQEMQRQASIKHFAEPSGALTRIPPDSEKREAIWTSLECTSIVAKQIKPESKNGLIYESTGAFSFRYTIKQSALFVNFTEAGTFLTQQPLPTNLHFTFTPPESTDKITIQAALEPATIADLIRTMFTLKDIAEDNIADGEGKMKWSDELLVLEKETDFGSDKRFAAPFITKPSFTRQTSVREKVSKQEIKVAQSINQEKLRGFRRDAKADVAGDKAADEKMAEEDEMAEKDEMYYDALEDGEGDEQKRARVCVLQ
ncbi:Hypothetical predicted protein [Lecanosticta acicola]|uniref:Uncharacterized protein n=1 Tax=Lecanosticta acicola TaxID=111012 RepID=A0AAI9EFV9_9PEZI|nr:Hypothetical predicted protein [Lecanosticta acicola]